MMKWWEENGPPTYVAAAAYLGLIKPKKRPSANTNNLSELLKMAGPNGIIN
jgi:hypothetical protein